MAFSLGTDFFSVNMPKSDKILQRNNNKNFFVDSPEIFVQNKDSQKYIETWCQLSKLCVSGSASDIDEKTHR